MDLEYSPAEVRKVKRVQFGVLSPDAIRDMSVVEVTSPLTFENGLPRPHGVMDAKMGTVDRNYRCQSCSGTRETCPGHFGHMTLARPVYHVGFLTITLRILRCVCFYCSRLLCDKDESENGDNNANVSLFREAMRTKNPRERLIKIWALCDKIKECGSGTGGTQIDDQDGGQARANSGCGRVQPKYRKGTGVKIEIEFPKKDGSQQTQEDSKSYLSAQRVYQIFSRISDVDCKIMGFNPHFCRPDWLLIQVLPVSPPAVRPFVMMDGMRPSQDDITHKLYDILKTNNALKRQEARGVPEHVLEELVDLLQFHVTTMIDNEVSGQPQAKQKSGKPLKSLRQRLVGKAGRVRGNLMGKRCDFSARTVIGGDPNLSIDQVGVPRSIASNLTYPERVTKYNLQKMKKLVANGPSTHPGAKTIIRDDGKQIDLRYLQRTSDANLETGYIVERHIQDGDVVLFNRQPSLHKMSMMAHFVKILPWSTFRINLSVTSPYNADFDGDEMNLHVPQSEMARSELINLALVPTQIVSPQGNKPVMGIVQDSLLASMKFTKRDCFLERHQVFNLLMWLDASWDGTIPIPCILKPKPLWTGKQILSLILPKVNLVRTSNGRPDNEKGIMSASDTLVRIEQGEILCGIIDKRTIGSSSGGLIHVIFNEYGAIVCKRFFNEMAKLTGAFFLMHSSSIGIGDAIADASTIDTIARTIQSARGQVRRTIQQSREGKLQRRPGQSLIDTFEGGVNSILNKAMNDAGKAVKKALHKLNNLKQMVDAGSKGNAINISQILACVGQQNVQGKRIGYGFSDRSLPHFNKGDIGPEARGFVANSYLKGLTPQEVFFHAMGGREGLVDTAVKTASTGYIQRRLIKAMEDVIAVYDRTVRNSMGHVIQFLYGEDGLDAVKIEKQKMPHIMLSNEKFQEMYQFDLLQDHNRDGDDFLDPMIKEVIRNDHRAIIALRTELKALEDDRDFFRTFIFPMLGNEASLYLPVNIERLIWNAQKEFGINKTDVSEINPIDIVETVNELIASIIVLPADPSDPSDEIRAEAQKNATMLFKMLVRATLASKRVCKEYKLTLNAFNFVTGEIKRRFDQAIVDAGEVVGTIAAQSIGEPATQMTLNTFHFAGVSAKNVTLGVPRLHELINVANNIKTPSLTVYLIPEVACDQDKAKQVLNKLEYCRLRDIVAKTQIFYDPDPRNSVVESDHEFLEDFFEFTDEDMEMFDRNASPWMLRLVLDRAKKEDKGVINQNIAEIINEKWANDVRCLFSNDNADELVLQIRLLSSFSGNDAMGGADGVPDMMENDNITDGEDSFLRRLEEKLLDDIELNGIPGIKKVFMRREDCGVWDAGNGEWVSKARSDWVLDTEGTRLLEVMAVDEVDEKRTISNHVVEIFEVLGIEAARQALMNEIRNVISFDGSYVNYRHLAILVDTMTYQGHLMSITRHGINRRETGPMMRCSFEETVEILLEAAHFATPDDLLGCSENIMLGQLVPIGTGACDLLLDTEMLEKQCFDDQGFEEIGYGLYDSMDRGEVLSPAYNMSPMSMGGMSPYGGYDKMMGGGDDGSKLLSPMGMSPSSAFSPLANAPAFSPTQGGYTPLVSPMMGSDGGYASSSHGSPDYISDGTGMMSPGGVRSPNYSPTSPNYSPTSPNYSPTSPNYSPTSPNYSPTSPNYSPTSPNYSPTSPNYSPTSPTYSPTSPTYSPTSPTYSPTSPTYSPTSPTYSPTSPTYSPTSPTYSPTSPTYSPTSPTYSPTSPTYSPTSPTYSPTSPTYSPTSPTYSPTSPTYSPTSPTYSPTSPSYSPTSPTYSPTSPTYSPTSPSYSPTSPAYSPQHLSPSSPMSPHTSPTSPSSPSSPHSPHSPASPTSPTSPSSPHTSPMSPASSPQYSNYSVSWSGDDGAAMSDDPGATSSGSSSSSSGIDEQYGANLDHEIDYSSAASSSGTEHGGGSSSAATSGTGSGIPHSSSGADDGMSGISSIHHHHGGHRHHRSSSGVQHASNARYDSDHHMGVTSDSSQLSSTSDSEGVISTSDNTSGVYGQSANIQGTSSDDQSGIGMMGQQQQHQQHGNRMSPIHHDDEDDDDIDNYNDDIDMNQNNNNNNQQQNSNNQSDKPQFQPFMRD